MKKLVHQFANDWKGEAEKQKSMSKRAKEILLRWGEFSEQYVERAGFLSEDSETWSERFTTIGRMLLLLVSPVFSLYLFWFDVPEDSTLLGSIFVASAACVVPQLVQSPT